MIEFYDPTVDYFKERTVSPENFCPPRNGIHSMYVEPKQTYIDIYDSKKADMHIPFAHVVFENKEQLNEFISLQVKIYPECKVRWWGPNYIYVEHLKR